MRLGVLVGAVLLVTTMDCFTASPAAVSSPTPKTLLAESRTGDYMSGPFSTTGNWELRWSYDCSKVTTGSTYLIVAVYRQSDSDPKTAALFDAITPSPRVVSGVNLEARDTTAGPPKGTFYLKVSSGCPWHITVVG